MRGVMHDLRAAMRSLRRAPGFVLMAAVTLAVAIAVNGAMFAFVNAAFVRALPFTSPERLHHVRLFAAGAERFEQPVVRQVRAALAPFGTLAAYTERGFVVTTDAAGGGAGEAAPDVVQGSAADDRLFDVLGVRPVVGRAFDPGDVVPGAPPTVIVSDAFWRVRLDRGADVLGRTLRIDGNDHSIIGIMPAHFGFPDFAQIWVPLAPSDARLGGALQVLLRLRDGATPEAASAALQASMLAAGQPARVVVRSLLPRGGALLVALLGAIGFVLLIACSNVANLVLARGTARRHEMAVRNALGATRGALLRYLSVEGGVIALIAAVTGVVATPWLCDLVVGAIPADQLPEWFDARVDVTVLAYVTGIAVVATVMSATMPAVTLTRGALSATLTEAGGRAVGDAAAGRMRNGLVAVQIALATVLLAGAVLLLRSFGAMRAIDPGYAADAILELPTLRPPVASADDVFTREAMARLDAVPGVAATAAIAPPRQSGRIVSSADPDRRLGVQVEAVSPSYFHTIGLSLVRGEGFREGVRGEDVAVISVLTARQLFEDADAALGATFSFENDPERRVTVVGVATDRRRRIGGESEPATFVAHVYLPLEAGDVEAVRLLVRAASGDPAPLAPAATAALRSMGREVVVRMPRNRGDTEREQAGDLRWFATLFGAFGAVALALAALGIWGVTAYTVSRRTREIGVRMTLGATGSRIVREVAAGVLPAAGLGLGSGLLGAIGIGYLLRGVLYGVRPADPLTLVVVLAAFVSITLLAAWAPARRAARIDPLSALRMD